MPPESPNGTNQLYSSGETGVLYILFVFSAEREEGGGGGADLSFVCEGESNELIWDVIRGEMSSRCVHVQEISAGTNL